MIGVEGWLKLQVFWRKNCTDSDISLGSPEWAWSRSEFDKDTADDTRLELRLEK